MRAKLNRTTNRQAACNNASTVCDEEVMKCEINWLKLGLVAGLLAAATALRAQQTVTNGTPTGDPSRGVDWNVTSPTGATQERQAADGIRAYRGYNGWDLGTTQGYAYTYAAVGHLDVMIYRYYSRTAGDGQYSATTAGQYNASASFYDSVTFAGSGSGVVTFSSNIALFTRTSSGTENYPGMPEVINGGTEINNTQTAEAAFTFVLKNGLGQTVSTVTQGFRDFYQSNGDIYSRSYVLSTGETGGAVGDVSFNLQSGYSVEIYGNASATAYVFATYGGTNWGQADVAAMLTTAIAGLSEGWSYSTLSGQSLTAVPEPSTYALLGGAGVLGFVLWRRRR